MELLEQARRGIASVAVDEDIKQHALGHLLTWLTATEFAAYRPQLDWLIRAEQWAGIVDRFYQILPFGTGGRRGAVGIGPNRMNAWTLGASVQGHCEYLKERFPGQQGLSVAIAYDVRCFMDKRKNYNAELPNPIMGLSSKMMAQAAAMVYAANGIAAYILPPESNRYLATPELSYAIRHLKAHGGLNISASHNPPDDNGGKFYDERGGQPVPPDDQIMADLVDQVKTIRSLPFQDAVRAGKIRWLPEETHQAYMDVIKHQSLVAPPKFDEVQIVFTPLHGVGGMTAMEALINQGFRVTPVEEQLTPDGQFPNVTKSPNPEVPESMDKAAALAQRISADLVLSTDPDADRIGAMAPDRQGAWQFITGNEIAAALTHFKLSKLAQQGRMPSSPIVVRTEVTTRLVTRIARHFKCQVVDDLLVGFKYVADVIWQLEQTGRYGDVRGTPEDFLIASEESHGILVTPRIRDKDSAGAALLLAELALDQKRQGSLFVEYIDKIYRQFGYHVNRGVNIVMPGILGKKSMGRLLDMLRAEPPTHLGSYTRTGYTDLRDEAGRMGKLKGNTDLASRNVLLFEFGEYARAALRPSGTEPKAKVYIEFATPPCPSSMPLADWDKLCLQTDAKLNEFASLFVHHALGKIGMDPKEVGFTG